MTETCLIDWYQGKNLCWKTVNEMKGEKYEQYDVPVKSFFHWFRHPLDYVSSDRVANKNKVFLCAEDDYEIANIIRTMFLINPPKHFPGTKERERAIEENDSWFDEGKIE